jgi:hypothetical protein
VAVVDVRGVEVEVARVAERVVLALAPAAPRRGAQRALALPPEPSHQPREPEAAPAAAAARTARRCWHGRGDRASSLRHLSS